MTEVDWLYAGKAYVPVSVKAKGSDWRKADLKFEMSWEHVNELVPDALFSEEALELITGDSLLAKKNDVSVIERMVGAKTSFDIPAKETTGLRRRWGWIFGTHIPLGFALWYWMRRKRKQNEGGL